MDMGNIKIKYMSIHTCGWYGVVRRRLIPSKEAKLSFNSLLNSFPWSDNKTLGRPIRMKTLHVHNQILLLQHFLTDTAILFPFFTLNRRVATVAAVLSAVGMASTHLVK